MSVAPIVALYTHKGGVSKTTNTMHLAWLLAQKFGKRVLCVDADPQCNLTQLLIPESRKDSNFLKGTQFTSIYDILSPIFHGQSKEVSAAACLQVRPREFSKGALFLIPGSLDLSTFEPIIALAHSLSTSPAYKLFDSLPGAIRSMVQQTATENLIDIVLVDMGPSIGELNRNLFYSSDFFIVPTSADVYCKATINTMQTTLNSWATNHRTIALATRNHTLPLNSVLPKFLGVIVSMFNVAGKEGKPVKQSQTWIDLIKLSVENSLAPNLHENNMLHTVQVEGHCLAEIPNFLSLLPIAQRASYPVYAIPDERFEVFDENKGEYKKMSKTEIENNKRRGQIFEKIYEEFAHNLINVLSGN
eukprot:GAHX01000080.1.p1 GENE.GAHX01000080.1~~GAHX01000080.1.p1  ORF type:complete len:360 (+),score=54.05 GAHX01000080.1:48-1127(+)